MGGAHTLRRVSATVALAAVAVLAGCTKPPAAPAPEARPATDTPSKSRYGSDDPSTPATEAPGLTTPTKAPSAAEWPDKAVPAAQAPRLGDSKVIAAGYRVDDFLSGLAARWDVALGEQKLIDVPGDRKRWHFSGAVSNGGRQRLSIGGVPEKNGDIVMFACEVDSDREKAGAFLTDCAGTGIPGWDRERAAAWLKTAKQQVDAVYANEKGKGAVTSALYVSDGAYAFLTRAPYSTKPQGMYVLRVSGGGIAENS
ncbi:hypothetical protein OG462_18465 [Streptomyces sp. NBC_01077]|uniref:hypothetical protein n=1 Tax=Streptomyces sp. NBC_01077 TaxID=2903746 RepID=UPI003868EC32|nr:hypothetical protein OG462_18465 [Streptomyces sp. NBC_01077]